MKKWILTITALLSVIAVAEALSSGCSATPPVVDGPEDPSGDLFDKNGATVTGENYLDITAVDIQKDDGGRKYYVHSSDHRIETERTPCATH